MDDKLLELQTKLLTSTASGVEKGGWPAVPRWDTARRGTGILRAGNAPDPMPNWAISPSRTCYTSLQPKISENST